MTLDSKGLAEREGGGRGREGEREEERWSEGEIPEVDSECVGVKVLIGVEKGQALIESCHLLRR